MTLLAGFMAHFAHETLPHLRDPEGDIMAHLRVISAATALACASGAEVGDPTLSGAAIACHLALPGASAPSTWYWLFKESPETAISGGVSLADLSSLLLEPHESSLPLALDSRKEFATTLGLLRNSISKNLVRREDLILLGRTCLESSLQMLNLIIHRSDFAHLRPELLAAAYLLDHSILPGYLPSRGFQIKSLATELALAGRYGNLLGLGDEK